MSDPDPNIAPPGYQAPPAPPAYQAPPAPPAYQAPPAQPGAYPPPAYGGAPGYAAAPAYGGYGNTPKTNTLAIISLVASIVGFVWILPFIGSLAGVITGHMALGQIKRTGENGHGMALAGTIVGYAGLALAVIGVIAIVAIITIAAATYPSSAVTVNPLVP